MKKRALVILAVLAILNMAPTAGDVGGCGTSPTLLDLDAYRFARKNLECRRCDECGTPSARCTRACDPAVAPETRIPDTCSPLFHDGIVCLRALEAASCDAFGTYVEDRAPATPSECEFCRVGLPEPVGALFDGGAPSTGGGGP